MLREWRIGKRNNILVKKISSQLGISQILASLLINRGITSPEEAESFLYTSLYDLYEPYLLKDMDKAVLRIKKAITNKELIYLHGDYDVDGISSLAMLYRFLRAQGIDLQSYIPHRIEEGYGVSRKAVADAQQKGAKLFITVDCGITAHEAIKQLVSSGIDVIVIDHHCPKKKTPIPHAFATINPWQEGCNYPNKELTSSGLVFKLLQALIGLGDQTLESYLDLASLGLIADLAPLRGENRIIVKYGLEKIRDRVNTGLKALMDIAGIKKEYITTRIISHIIAPRINAVGRLGSAENSLHILISDDNYEAERLAAILDEQNRERQQLEAEIIKEIREEIDSRFDFKTEKIIILEGRNWHRGVIGIVASRIVERYYRPAIILTEQDGILYGSGRSIQDFHLFDAISSCEDFLQEYGGHAFACGLSLKKENFASFKEQMLNYAQQVLSPEKLVPILDIDMELELNELREDLIKDLELLSPFGTHNPEPLFLTRGLSIISDIQQIPRRGIKFWVKKERFSSEAIGFGVEIAIDEIKTGASIDLVYTPEIREWEGIKTLSLYIKDYRIS